ncbi:MAG: hypothetical protein MJK04_22230 [Psychrosphaera sp.]|nr:hypothetical protein [Psychrosphaera sp.]
MRWFELTIQEKFWRFAIAVLGVLTLNFGVMQTEVALVIWVGFLIMHEKSIETRIDLEVIQADVEELKRIIRMGQKKSHKVKTENRE